MGISDKAAAYRALESHDARFDGILFVGVKSTGIYCRPICPARTPRYEHCTFYKSAAAAQEAGFRPCLRCRPETAPQLASWRGTSNTVSRALALISEGALDGATSSVENLAGRVGVGERQLRRLFLQHLGAPPVAVAQTRRVLFAKQLIHDTSLSMADIARASGFSSQRRFHEVFQNLFHSTPRSLRVKEGSKQAKTESTLRIRYRTPYDWPSMLDYLAARAIDGVELVQNNTYSRTVEVNGSLGDITVQHLPREESLTVTIRIANVQAFPAIVNRVRRLFDLGADISTIHEHLSQDKHLAQLVLKRPGLRVPGAWDGFEQAVRTVLGQQISVAAARRLAGLLVQMYGRRTSKESNCPLTHVFPDAKRLAQESSLGLSMPRARLDTLKAIAKAAATQPDLFQASASIEDAIHRLKSIPGIGIWSAQYIAMRAMREVDAFPSTDLSLLRGASSLFGAPLTPASLEAYAKVWRPWRAYAAQYLWIADSDNKAKDNMHLSRTAKDISL